jgi:uncharacterized protein DUF6176
MDQVCLALPIHPGKSDDARAFMHELETSRKTEYDASERRIGITKEVWFLAPLPSGDHLVAYLESEDFMKALEMFVSSKDDFDVWFKRRLADSTGLDLNQPPPGPLPELMSSYTA